MKPKMSFCGRSVLVVLLSIFFGCQSASEKQGEVMEERVREFLKEKELVVYFGCNNIEIIHDLSLSVDQNLNILKEYNIELTRDTTANKCGYLLKKGEINKSFDSAITDVDLMLILKDFFKD